MKKRATSHKTGSALIDADRGKRPKPLSHTRPSLRKPGNLGTGVLL